jgi:hypothetical protein
VDFDICGRKKTPSETRHTKKLQQQATEDPQITVVAEKRGEMTDNINATNNYTQTHRKHQAIITHTHTHTHNSHSHTHTSGGSEKEQNKR